MELLVIVQTVTAQQLQQRAVLHPLVGDIGQIHTCRITLVLDVETELRLLDRRGEVVHVLHHQFPVALRGVVRRVLQRFYEEGALGVWQVGGKLSHLVGHTSSGKLISHSQHLIGLQSRPQRHIAQGLVHSVFRRCQQSGTGQLLVVTPIVEACDGREHRGGLVDVAGSGILCGQRTILVVGAIARHALSQGTPNGIAQRLVLAQISQGDDVAGVRGRSGLVGHPDLHTTYFDAGGDVRQG